MPSLNVWMNGELVGDWTTSRSGNPIFRYTESWMESPRARALSLSLPMTRDREVRGPAVDYYFDNLLPDNTDIRNRVRERFGLRSSGTFDLLEAIGRDCVGAVQLLPPEQEPIRWNHIDAEVISTAEVERTLRSIGMPVPYGYRAEAADDQFRISIAGAQQKTALLRMNESWYRPRNATPTTHILKLPLGIVGNFRGNFSNSVENEWLCARFMREFGIPIADTEVAKFGEQQALVVTRFDRRWIGIDNAVAAAKGFAPSAGTWIARLPQEDFCQATGRSPGQKYERDGGPTMEEILEILAGSEHPESDRKHFVLAQLAFWLLAAIDGHGKNFSIHHRPGGSFGLTPLYDVLSAWTVIGRGANQLPIQDAKLAMALAGRRRHYRIVEIQARHWHALAQRVGGNVLWEQMRALVESVGTVIDRIEGSLPHGFPEQVISKIANGVRKQANQFLESIAML